MVQKSLCFFHEGARRSTGGAVKITELFRIPFSLAYLHGKGSSPGRPQQSSGEAVVVLSNIRAEVGVESSA